MGELSFSYLRWVMSKPQLSKTTFFFCFFTLAKAQMSKVSLWSLLLCISHWTLKRGEK